MKRSLAPSSLYMSKIRKTGEETSVSLAPPTPVEGVNHLDLFSMKPHARPDEDSEDKENDGESTDKNFVVHRGGTPVCFGVSYVNLNKDQKNYMMGNGVLIVGFDSVTLYSIDHKELKTLPLVRDPPETDLDEHTESDEQSILYNPKGTGKSKTEVYFYIGNKVMIGTRRCELTFIFPMKDYRSGAVFLRFEETKKVVQAQEKKPTR